MQSLIIDTLLSYNTLLSRLQLAPRLLLLMAYCKKLIKMLIQLCDWLITF